MPLTDTFTSLTVLKGEGHIHSDKWHRCVEHVKANSPGVEPHAVCTHSIGYKESINPEHRTPGPHASANTRRFKESAKRRREAAAKHDISFAQVLKFNPNEPRDAEGKWTAGGAGGSKSTLTPEQQKAQDELAVQAAKPVRTVKTPEEAVQLILKGENVEIEDTKDVHTVLAKLGELAIEAAKSEKTFSYDPCSITVKGTSIFCNEKLKTKEFPHGIPRIEMPQFKSKNPIPGSAADKLPRDIKGEVDGSQEYLRHLEQSGVTVTNSTVLARKLKASQAEMEGAKVSGMMLNPNAHVKEAQIWVSRDGYVIDGHHTWAAAVGRDAADGNLDNDKEMDVRVVDLPMSTIYHDSVKWTRAYGLPSAGVKKRESLVRVLQYVAN